MPRYFLHIRDAVEDLLDSEGIEYASASVLQAEVLTMVRELVAADVMNGVVNLDQSLEAENSNGAVVHRLRFADAVEFRSSELREQKVPSRG